MAATTAGDDRLGALTGSLPRMRLAIQWPQDALCCAMSDPARSVYWHLLLRVAAHAPTAEQTQAHLLRHVGT